MGTPKDALSTSESGSDDEDSFGSIDEILNEPPIGVKGDETWCSCLLFYVFCPLNLIGGVITALCKCLMARLYIGCCSCSCWVRCCSIWGSVLNGRPFIQSCLWWKYSVVALFTLATQGSRLGVFYRLWATFGDGVAFFFGSGPWIPDYTEVDQILRSNQERTAAFACFPACIPDLFAEKILIFLSNTGSTDSEWWAIRSAIHEFLLATDGTADRIAQLPEQISSDWPNPKIEDLNDTDLLIRTVAKCVFFVMFNKWIDDEDAEALKGWRTNAGTFVLPRFVQRLLCNSGIRRVKNTRRATVELVERKNLCTLFENMNESLPEKYRRYPAVRLCDQIMYVIGFAGVGGTCACVESCAAFLQAKKPGESAASRIDFSEYPTSTEMIEIFRRNPKNYIMETCRLDPPVTSATHVLKEDFTTTLIGRKITFPKGTLSQYVVSLSNRDPAVFEDPEVFNPTRANLDRAHTWNGALYAEHEYPRICPGRYLSIDITKAILKHVVDGVVS